MIHEENRVEEKWGSYWSVVFVVIAVRVMYYFFLSCIRKVRKEAVSIFESWNYVKSCTIALNSKKKVHLF